MNTKISKSQTVEIDLTLDADYERLVEEELEEYSNIEVTEDLREGGIHAHDSWSYWYTYLSRTWSTSLSEEVTRFCNARENSSILSLGCGYGGVELSVARAINKPFQILGLDLNDGILDAPRKVAADENLPATFQAIDLNFVELPASQYDVVMAHASLHHLLNLEHVFKEIYKSLKDDGVLIVQDIIGKTQVLFWRENVEFVQDLIRGLPSRITAGAEIPSYVEPDIQVGMEGIRQQEIEEQIELLFKPSRVYHFGSFMRMICTHPVIGKNINPKLQSDRELLEILSHLDLQMIRQKVLRPTEMLGVYVKK
jgi:SAM-dependent methyltransferase